MSIFKHNNGYKPPSTLKDKHVLIGGKLMDKTYGDFQAQMDRINIACEVMLEGDSKGRVFTFPIPTINITKDFDWNSPVIDKYMEITCNMAFRTSVIILILICPLKMHYQCVVDCV